MHRAAVGREISEIPAVLAAAASAAWAAGVEQGRGRSTCLRVTCVTNTLYSCDTDAKPLLMWQNASHIIYVSPYLKFLQFWQQQPELLGLSKATWHLLTCVTNHPLLMWQNALYICMCHQHPLLMWQDALYNNMYHQPIWLMWQNASFIYMCHQQAFTHVTKCVVEAHMSPSFFAHVTEYVASTCICNHWNHSLMKDIKT